MREFPISCPIAFKKVLSIPPPRIILSDLDINFLIRVNLVEILAPDIIVVIGLFCDDKSFFAFMISSCSKSPANVSRYSDTPYIDAVLRCDTPNASNTYTSPRSDIFLDNIGEFSFSPS